MTIPVFEEQMEKDQYHNSAYAETSAAIFVHFKISGCNKCLCKFSVITEGGDIIDKLEDAVSYRVSNVLLSAITV
jgi:hypothetical protein